MKMSKDIKMWFGCEKCGYIAEMKLVFGEPSEKDE